jgi:hypothetical protein
MLLASKSPFSLGDPTKGHIFKPKMGNEKKKVCTAGRETKTPRLCQDSEGHLPLDL